jgi:glycosyltransferase 2 family protein
MSAPRGANGARPDAGAAALPDLSLGAPRRVARLRWLRVALQFVVTAILLAVLWRMNGGAAMWQRLGRADPGWVAAGLVFATGAMLAGGLRWRYTAERLGVRLGMQHALREFYLSMFLNQVLPGGVGGDALRAFRHGKGVGAAAGPTGPEGAAGVGTGWPEGGAGRVGVGAAVRAVFIERLANQLVLSGCVVGSMALWPSIPGLASARHIWMPLAGVVAAVLAAGAAAFFVRRGGKLERFLGEARQAFLNGTSLPAQVGLGVLLLANCLALFYCSARALGAPVSAFYVVALVPPALFSMSIPISLGGWGLREASVVALWAMAGLPAADGLASSVLYGAIALASTLPGAAVLVADR